MSLSELENAADPASFKNDVNATLEADVHTYANDSDTLPCLVRAYQAANWLDKHGIAVPVFNTVVKTHRQPVEEWLRARITYDPYLNSWLIGNDWDGRVMSMAIAACDLTTMRIMYTLGCKPSSRDILIAMRLHDSSPHTLAWCAQHGKVEYAHVCEAVTDDEAKVLDVLIKHSTCGAIEFILQAIKSGDVQVIRCLVKPDTNLVADLLAHIA